MLTFIARRLLLAVPVLLGVVFVVMLTVELIPGDAVALKTVKYADLVRTVHEHQGQVIVVDFWGEY